MLNTARKTIPIATEESDFPQLAIPAHLKKTETDFTILTRFSPQQLFWGFITLHLFLWTLIPTLVSPNVPLDVIEGFAWGHEWLIGTYKHPPMQAWWLETLATLTYRAPWAHFLASQIAVVTAFWAVWQTGRRLTTETNALLGAMLLEGVIYYNFTTPEFNPNVLQLPFWALMIWSFHRAVKENRWYDWAQFGVWASGAMYTKYSSLLIIGVLGSLLVFHPEARRRWRDTGPYLSMLVAVALLLPHLQWLIAQDFLPLTYAQSRIEPSTAWYEHITAPLGFLRSQIVAVLFCVILFLALVGFRNLKLKPFPHSKFSFDDVFLHTITWAPKVALLVMSTLTGDRLRDMWGSSLWNFIGLWLIIFIQPTSGRIHLPRFVKSWAVVSLLGLIAGGCSTVLGPYLGYPTQRQHFPGRAAAEQITNIWNARFQKTLISNPPPQPLTYIIGDTWLAGNVAYYTPSSTTGTRPHVSIFGNIIISPWARLEDIAAKGGVIVWCNERCTDATATLNVPSNLLDIFPAAEIQQPLILPRQTHADVPPATIGWAIIPPGMKNKLKRIIH